MNTDVDNFASRQPGPRSRRNGGKLRLVAVIAVALCASLSAAGPSFSPASASPASASPRTASASSGTVRVPAGSVHPGKWIALEATPVPFAGDPALWMGPGNKAWVVWYRPAGLLQTYEVAVLGADGGIAVAPKDVFAGKHWSGVTDTLNLVGHGSVPLLIFAGTRGTGPYSQGCVYGAVPSSPGWSLEPWSLSNDCVNPQPSATEGKGGVLSAAWSGGWATGHGVQYRIGTVPGYQATTPDGRIAIPSGDVFDTAEVADLAGNGDIYVAWQRVFSKPGSGDGYYVKDVSANGAVKKAPGSGTNSVNFLPIQATTLPFASTNTHAGVYLAYCSNGSTCTLELWRVGASKAVKVPGSSGAYAPQMSAGPDGRLWLAWYNETTNKVSVVRTNKSDTKFGPVQVLATPCFEHGLLGLSGGSWGRLDIAMGCVNNAHLAEEEYATQALVPLSLHVGTIAGHSVSVKVTDVGDPVAGAGVTIDGRSAVTNASGTATISFPSGIKAGKYGVTATAVNYLAAHGILKVA